MPTNVACDPFNCEVSTYVIENITTFTLHLKRYFAVQGFALFDNWGDGCPLESVSREAPYQFTDETQILKVESNYDDFYNRRHPCIWQFSAPKGYGFKVIVLILDISNNTHLRILNSNETFLTNANITPNVPYYSKDNYLKIILSENRETSLRKKEFSAYLMIVNLHLSDVQAECFSQTEQSITYWYSKSLPNNGICSFIYTIKPKTEVLIEYAGALENGIDSVNLYFDGNGSVPLDLNWLSLFFDVPNLLPISLYPYQNGTERNVLLQFVSDGSWQSFKFEMKLLEIECSCNDRSIFLPCNSNISFNIMNNPKGYYCGNLNCNFTINVDHACSDKIIFEMRIQITDDSYMSDLDIFDVFKIYSNNSLEYEINYMNRKKLEHILLLPASDTTIFKVLTVSLLASRTMNIKLSTFSPPSFIPKITLTEDMPYYTYSLCSSTSIFSIELSEQFKQLNASIDIYLSDLETLDTVIFRSDKYLTHKVHFNNCFEENAANKMQCKTLTSNFIVYRSDICMKPMVILFQVSNLASGCVFSNNVFYMAKESALSTSTMSTKTDVCTIFFLKNDLESFYTLKEIVTTTFVVSESLKIYVGSQNKLLATIDLKTISYWQNIPLNSAIYIFKIPKNTAILFHLKSVEYPSEYQITNKPYYSIASSPFYAVDINSSSSEDSLSTGHRLLYNITNATVKFTLLHFESSMYDRCSFFENYTSTDITSNFTSITFSNTEVELYFDCTQADQNLEFSFCAHTFNVLLSVETLPAYTTTVATTTPARLTSITTSFESSTEIPNSTNRYGSLIFALLLWSLFLLF